MEHEPVIGVTRPQEEEFLVGRVTHLPIDAAFLNHQLSGLRVNVEQPFWVSLTRNFVRDRSMVCVGLIGISSYHFHHNSPYKCETGAEHLGSTRIFQK